MPVAGQHAVGDIAPDIAIVWGAACRALTVQLPMCGGCYGVAFGGRIFRGRSRDGAQARGAARIAGNGVDDDGGRGDIAVRAAGNRQRQIRFAAQFDGVRRMLRADVHLKFHEDFVFALPDSARDLMDSGDLAGGDFEKFRLHGFRGDDRLDRFGDFVDAKPRPSATMATDSGRP